ncbi:MAG: tetratricopeptide repeat protein [Cyclobacteriaceae bacterium]|jgi:tetratricopeptide (TPR) repeat protein|nr:tetratricopeptide repeat protein [Cyclobacteriaceae bacterium]
MPRIVFFLSLLLLVFSSAVAQTPKWKSLEVEADTLLNRQDYLGAIKLYTKVIKASKLQERDDYAAVYKRGLSYYSSANFTKAIEDMNVFIPKFPDSFQGHVLRALSYRELDDTENQLSDVEEAFRISRGDAQIMRWRASLYLELSKYQEVINDLTILKLVQDDSEIESNLAFAYYSLGKPDSAFMALNKSIELEPTYLPAYLYGGSFALQESDFELALKYLNIALRLEPDNYTAWFYKGIALIELKQEDKGCSCLQKAFYGGVDDAGDYLKQYCFGEED